jgi:hypothetical protein
MRVIMSAIIDQAGRQFNVEEADGINKGHSILVWLSFIFDSSRASALVLRVTDRCLSGNASKAE